MSRIEARPVRIPHEMKRPSKEAAIVLVIADMDDADVARDVSADRRQELRSAWLYGLVCASLRSCVSASA
jgi:hypothetical protein